jgi:hypothetical protein
VFKRLFWLSVGLGLGVTVAIQLSRWTRRQRERMSPANIAHRAGEGISDLGSRVSEFVEEFRSASAEREADLRAKLED